MTAVGHPGQCGPAPCDTCRIWAEGNAMTDAQLIAAFDQSQAAAKALLDALLREYSALIEKIGELEATDRIAYILLEHATPANVVGLLTIAMHRLLPVPVRTVEEI